MDYKFEVIDTAAQPVLSVRTVTSIVNLTQEMEKAYKAILAYLGEIGEQPADAPFAAYFNTDMENIEVEMGFPVAKELVGKSEIPAGKKVTCMHKGSYTEMGPTYEAMTKWINDNGHQPTGVVYEFYYNSPKEVPESELLTKIVFLLK